MDKGEHPSQSPTQDPSLAAAHHQAHGVMPTQSTPEESEKAQEFQSLLNEYMSKVQKRKAITMGISSCIMSLVTAPLLTMATSLQLSSKNMRVTYNDFQTKKGGVMSGKLGVKGEADPVITKVNVLKSRNVPLPFKPLSYTGYLECTHGLFRQGMFAFYKGNGIRCTHMMLFHYLRTDLSLKIDKLTGGNFGKNLPFAKEFIIATLADFLLHPLHNAEGRFILQNRHMNFATYPSLGSFFKQSYGEMWRGILLHIPRNVCMAFSGVSFIQNMDIKMFYLQNFLVHFIAYPFLTVQRRLECQSKTKKTLLPMQYKHAFNAFRQIIKQEGVRALYKGFTAYSWAIVVWILTVPSIAQLNMLNSPFANEEDQRDINFKGEVNPMDAYNDEAEDIYDEDLRAAAKS